MTRNFQQRKHRFGWRHVLESRPVLAALGILLLFFMWGVAGFVGKLKTTRANRQIAENEVVLLREEKIKLSTDIEKLQTESGIEENIREKFGLAKKDEGLIVIVDDKNKVEEVEEDEEGFFSSIWHWLF